MSSDSEILQRDMIRALTCLYITVAPDVAEEVQRRVYAYVECLDKKYKELLVMEDKAWGQVVGAKKEIARLKELIERRVGNCPRCGALTHFSPFDGEA